MSEYKRLKRVLKSLIPRFPKDEDRQYSLADARNMINDVGLQMSSEVLEKIVSKDKLLDDFLDDIYYLESDIGRKVVTDYATIDMKYNPRVYVEGDLVGFSITHKGEEIVFAEYELNKR